jgi:hypothetical protein
LSAVRCRSTISRALAGQPSSRCSTSATSVPWISVACQAVSFLRLLELEWVIFDCF